MHVNKVEISSYNMQNSIMKRPFPSERSSDVNESQRLLSEVKKKKRGKKMLQNKFYSSNLTEVTTISEKNIPIISTFLWPDL